ncbi:N(2)-acetyl-L-2,4-diaminobutanoate deacetylase DoeB [Pelagibius marinus]|uniref:N(2)-acetyl-L-2,4-diaminobutanoate deacetylase DoeB n=1 Tax=Pelagibius marinus TaxID=2762760 RepID=UPI001872DB53|nr:N(2)-acetyl-L-2,4-diaminobutanoate deacetylase DoeB [Pelagibius marinus]
MAINPISCSLDFDQDGVQHGHLKLPYSRDDSAWGAILIPITVIKNGDGPTALFTGGNHGDEYEGPVALLDMALNLEPSEISGRVILLPMMNYPAVRGGRRTSPIDGGNLNRLFPGKPDGTITQKIADYVTTTLLPLADVIADLHSGGKTLEFVPYAASHRLPQDPALEARCTAAMQAFNAPYSMIMLELDAVGMLDTEAEARGKIFVTTELGGGGSTTPQTVAVAKRGLRNILQHVGILPGKVAMKESFQLDMPDERCFVTSEHAGMLEFMVELGASVREGDIIARVYDLDRSGWRPVEYTAYRDGVVAGRHYPGLVQSGDTLAVIAVPQN